MTLVLSCVTPEYVFQVSDRQLTYISGPQKGTVADKHSNKAVLLGGRMAFGYTGLAQVEGIRTDKWLTQTVSKMSMRNLKPVCDRIRDRATEAFRSERDRRSARLAFVGVGWIRPPNSRTLQPVRCTISNALNANDEWMDEAAGEFRLRVNNFTSWGNGGFLIASAGQPLKGHERKAIWRLLRRCARANAGPAAYIKALVLAMDFVASRYTTVGRNLMALSMPRIAVERSERAGGSQPLVFSQPRRDVNCFMYLPLGLAQK